MQNIQSSKHNIFNRRSTVVSILKNYLFTFSRFCLMLQIFEKKSKNIYTYVNCTHLLLHVM